MSEAAGVFVLVLAAVAANLPFLTRRIFFVFVPRAREKRFAWRLLEVVAMYLAVGAVARLLEARLGQIYPQGWEFYVITFCLFLVLAYPGFVYRYLWRRHD